MPYYPPSSGGGTVDAVVAGNNIDVDATDPANPVVAVETLNLADISDVTASSSEVNILDGATLTTTELNYVDGVTSAIQTQLNTKVDTANSPNSNEFARFTDADTIEGRTVAETKSDLSLVKGDVGLGNVDNTSDATKDAAATTLTNKTISGASNTITNIAASSLVTNAIGHGYVEIGRTTLGTAGSTISVTSLPNFKYLMVEALLIPNGGAITGYITFNGDTTAANYNRKLADNNGANADAPGALLYTTAGGTISYVAVKIINIAAQNKLIMSESVSDGGDGAVPVKRELTGQWEDSTNAISRVDFTEDGAGNYAIGSEVVVYGKN